MGDNYKQYYLKNRQLLDNSKELPEENKEWIRKFFEYQEIKLKRMNGLSHIDAKSYRTLYHYTNRFEQVSRWFNYKPCTEWTAKDVARVYNDLEDGKILNKLNKPFSPASRSDYYNKFFKSKPFLMLRLSEAAKDIIEYNPKSKEEVRYLEEKDFHEITKWVRKDEFILLYWLLWDYGENIDATLQLKKSDFVEQKNSDTKEPEYKLWWPKEILKRSRRQRAALNLHNETYNLLNIHLNKLNDNDLLFPKITGERARYHFRYACKRAKIKTKPDNKSPTLKDLRSSMACYCLKAGFSREEINNRLGHTPSSKEIDKYINFLAIDTSKTKKRANNFKIDDVKEEFDEYKKNTQAKIESMQALMEKYKILLDAFTNPEEE